MPVKVKEINFGMSKLEAIIAGLRLLSDTPQETWSRYITQQEHLEELVTILGIFAPRLSCPAWHEMSTQLSTTLVRAVDAEQSARNRGNRVRSDFG